MRPVIQRLKERKLVQWALAYLAGAWLVLQVLDVTAEPWGLSGGVVRGAQALLVFGFLVTLVLAWYHGEQGRQRVSGPELLIISGILGLGGLGLVFLGSERSRDRPGGTAPGTPPPTERDRPAVVVLPFDNLSPDPENAYFAAGMTEEITSRLTGISGLRVIARQAALRYEGSLKSIREIAEELGVDYVLEGTVRTDRGPDGRRQMRITPQLVRASDESQMWADPSTVDLVPGEIFRIQAEVAERVAQSMNVVLLEPERRQLTRRPTESLEAYERFLKGNYHLARRTENDLASAVAEYEASTRADPDFVNPVSRLGYSYAMLLSYGWTLGDLPADSLLARGLAAADRAISADPTVSDAWMARGFLFAFKNPQTFEGIHEAFERALVLNPRNAEAHHIYGWLLGNLGNTQEAVSHALRALSVDPSRAITLSALTEISLREHDIDQARRWVDSALAVDPAYTVALAYRTRVRLLAGETAEARTDAELALRFSGGDSVQALATLSLAAGGEGDSSGAREFAERAIRATEDPTTQALKTSWLAMALVGLGDDERALQLLEGVQPRGVIFWALLRWPEYDPIRSDPRFQALLQESEAVR